jgi:hypothetical protein
MHHRWVADAVRGGGDPPPEPSKPGLRGDELIDWFRRGWAELADLLDEMDDETPAWSWSGDNRVGFWRRRTALETLVQQMGCRERYGNGFSIGSIARGGWRGRDAVRDVAQRKPTLRGQVRVAVDEDD